MVVVAIFTAFNTLLSMIWNPGLIPRIFNNVVNDLKACIIYLSLLFFVSVVIMVLQPYTYIT